MTVTSHITPAISQIISDLRLYVTYFMACRWSDINPISSLSYIFHECILFILCELSFCSAQFLLENWFSIHSGMDTRWDPERQRKAEFSYFSGRNSGRKSWRVSKKFCFHLQNSDRKSWKQQQKTTITTFVFSTIPIRILQKKDLWSEKLKKR